MNQQSDRHPKKFAAIFLFLCLAAATGFGQTAALTLQINGDGAVSPFTSGQQLVIGKSYSMTAKANGGFTFTGWTGSEASGKSKLTFVMAVGSAFTANFADEEKPTLSMTAPTGSKALTSDAVIVAGRAKDNAAVANVFCQLNGTGWFPASTGNGWSNWWVNLTLNAGANALQAYAVDSSGNQSKIAKVDMTLIAVPVSLNGLTIAATPDGVNTNTKSFSAGTFSEDMAVGSYTFKKVNAATGKLSLKYAAPPMEANVSNDVTLLLQFTDSTNGLFTDSDGTSTFSLSQQTNLTPSQLAGTTINIDEGTNLTFPEGPQIIDNGSMFNVSNPLLISLSTPYPGEINDRVSVPFTQLQNYLGQWVQAGTPVFYGTVIAFNTNGVAPNADTVTILFDKSTFLSKTELFAPVVGSFVNISTYYYTNFLEGGVMTNGTGTFIFTNYSPVGALLQLNQAGENQFLILTFTNNSGSGIYYEESGTNQNYGFFGITLPPEIIIQPLSITNNISSTVSFSVTATGTQPLDYQWYVNGTTGLTDGTNPWSSVISGSTSNVLTLTGVATNDVGSYQVVVTNNFGSAISSEATLTITNY
jgi:hypothetical protein